MEKQVFYNPSQVAEISGVTRRTVYAWITEGHLPAVKHGLRLWRVREQDLQSFIEGRLPMGGGTSDPQVQSVNKPSSPPAVAPPKKQQQASKTAKTRRR
jgi:excisionase family DNA binding protein